MKNQILVHHNQALFTNVYLCVHFLETQLLYLCMQISLFKHLIAVPYLQEFYLL